MNVREFASRDWGRIGDPATIVTFRLPRLRPGVLRRICTGGPHPRGFYCIANDVGTHQPYRLRDGAGGPVQCEENWPRM
jgi:hypothetical protein